MAQERQNINRLEKLNKPLIVFYILVFYIFASFIWWSYLLLSHNRQNLQQATEVRIMQYEQQGISRQQLEDANAFQDLQNRYDRQVWMILGEGFVFILLLSFAVWRTRKSFQQEIKLARQQRNFLLSITHELKSPIASVKLALETMLKRDLNKERKEKVLSNSIHDINRLQTLVEDILLAAKFEDHRFEFAKDRIDLSELVHRSTVKIMDDHEDKRQFDVHIQQDIEIIGDRQSLNAVVNNLLENAVKYSTLNSNISLSLKKLDSMVSLEVADEGLGIAEEERENIFKKFYRVGNEETRRTKGTGLGLFIVKEVVQGHNGTIEVDDNIPKGTRFTVTIPANNN